MKKSDVQVGVITTAIALIAAYIVISLGWSAYKTDQENKAANAALVRSIKDTKATIAEIAKLNKAKIVETTALIKDVLRIILKDKALPDAETVDAWSTPIKIVVDGDIENGKCVVTSAGPDQTFDTKDDITEWKTTAMAVGKDIGRTTTNLGVGIIKGVVESAKENFGSNK